MPTMFFFCVSFISIIALAQLCSAATSSDSVVSLDTMVVTASKLPQSPGNVTQKIDVIGRATIESSVSAHRNLSDLIAAQPGASASVLSRNDANWGTYGGIGPKYSTYMLQGLPIDAFVDPMSLDANIIDRIEVQRGPASVLYPNYLSQDFAGNQSPLAGTVNLLLKESVDKKETSVRTSYGSYNTLNGQIFHQDRIGTTGYFGGASYEQSDYTDYGIENSWLNMKKDPQYKKAKVYGGLSLPLDDKGDQAFSLFGQKTLHTGDAGRVYRGFNHDYGTFNAGYRALLGYGIRLQSHVGIRSYDRSWQESSFGTIDTLKSVNGVHQWIVPADLSLSYLHLSGSLLTVGGDYQAAYYNTWSDPLTGIPLYGNKSSALQGGGYVQEEFRMIENLTVRGGLRMAYMRTTIDLIDGNAPGDPSMRWMVPLWSTGARYSFYLTPAASLSLYANGGSSFIAPGLKSIGGTIKQSDRGVLGRNGQLPNPDLKPESGIGFDGGADLRLPRSLALGLRGFYTKVDDAIVENRVSENPSQTQSINAGGATSAGGEIELRQNIAPTFSWFANFTYMKTAINNERDTDQDGAEIPFAPEQVANAGITYFTPFGLQLTPSINYNGGYYDATSKKGRKRFEPGLLLNMYIAQRIVTGSRYTVECFSQLYNITNNDYEMPWQFKDPGFSGMGGITLRF